MKLDSLLTADIHFSLETTQQYPEVRHVSLNILISFYLKTVGESAVQLKLAFVTFSLIHFFIPEGRFSIFAHE
jgi:hypothetical protein